MDTENGIVSDLRLPSSRSNGGAGVVLMSLPLAWDNVGVASQVAQRMLEFDQPRVEREGTLKKCIFQVVDLSVFDTTFTIVVVIIVRIVFICSFFFECLLLNHSFQINPNRITNCIQLLFLIIITTTFHIIIYRRINIISVFRFCWTIG